MVEATLSNATFQAFDIDCTTQIIGGAGQQQRSARGILGRQAMPHKISPAVLFLILTEHPFLYQNAFMRMVAKWKL